MIEKISIIVIATIILTTSLVFSSSFADEQNFYSEIIPLDNTIGIEKTVVTLHAPSYNVLPWGFVEGKIKNHVSEYPVIIQIYDDGGEAIHFAQTNVKEDGSYEYKFRVLSVEDGKTNHIFEGDYMVKIFKVIYLSPDSLNQI